MKTLNYIRNVTLGCDPEFFFTGSKGQTTGAEKVLPEKGILYDAYYGDVTTPSSTTSKIVIDGVQAEMNPRPNLCRANLGNEMKACFQKLKKAIDDKGIKVNFKPVVSVTKKEMDSLSDKAKIFGCAPSTNIYSQAESQITVDPKVYRKRSAGGHIHLGAENKTNRDGVKGALSKPDVLVPILDIIVGNTCVLIDRSPNNKERRKVYGRCGEFRVKPYGLEYRTLSNFWLQSYQLMSFVMGLSRLAVHVVAQTDTNDPERNYVAAFTAAVNREDIMKAVNENDFGLAYSNFLKIEPLILELAGENIGDYPLNKNNIEAFHFFLSRGIDKWFTEEPLEHWTTMDEGHGNGWESFLDRHVKPNIIKEQIVNLNKKLNDIRNTKATTTKLLKAQLTALKRLDPTAKIKKVVTVKQEIEVKIAMPAV